jgi:hypothetical protein
MGLKLFFSRIKNLILSPEKAWDTIYSENRPLKDPMNSFFYPLIILIAISAFFGSYLFSRSEFGTIFFILTGIRYFLLMFISVYVTALILREIAKALDLKADFAVSFKLVVFSAAPLFLCQILSRLFESLLFVNILSLYGLYIFWTGAEKMLNPAQHKKVPLLIATFVVFTGTFFIANWLLVRIVERTYFALFA